MMQTCACCAFKGTLRRGCRSWRQCTHCTVSRRLTSSCAQRWLRPRQARSVETTGTRPPARESGGGFTVVYPYQGPQIYLSIHIGKGLAGCGIPARLESLKNGQAKAKYGQEGGRALEEDAQRGCRERGGDPRIVRR
jgi:hypothetical protein